MSGKSVNRVVRIEKKRIRFYLYFGSIASIVLLTGFLFTIYTNHLEKSLSAQTGQLSTSIINEKKIQLRGTIDSTIAFIDFTRATVATEWSSKGVSQEKINDITIEIVSKYIRNLRPADKKGYIWVNHILNYQGGDGYAIRKIHPNLPDTEGMLLSTDMVDSLGNKSYQTELDGINKEGEVFFEYYFKKIDSEKISRKLSFIKLYPPFDWTIGTGIHLDDLDQLVANKIDQTESTRGLLQRQAFVIALVALFFSILIIIILEKKISRLILNYEVQISQYTEKLEQLSATDHLTNLSNRLKLDEVFVNEIGRAKRYQKPLSIILVDVDKFKLINDTYGHIVGDQVLQELAEIFKRNIRSTDTIGRWGGEEFLIICPETGLDEAIRLADKVRQYIEVHPFPEIDSATCSFGVSYFKNNDDTKESIVNRADEALYLAKRGGRNQVVGDTPSSS